MLCCKSAPFPKLDQVAQGGISAVAQHRVVLEWERVQRSPWAVRFLPAISNVMEESAAH